MSWLDPIAGNRAATDQDYADAVANFHTPMGQYLNAKILGGSASTSAGLLYTYETLPDKAIAGLSDDQVRDVYNMLPRAQQYPYSGPNLAPNDPMGAALLKGSDITNGLSPLNRLIRLNAGASSIIPPPQAPISVRSALPGLFAQLSPEERDSISPVLQDRLKQFGINYMTKAQYQNSPWSRPNLDYEEFTTPDRASARADIYDINQFRAWQIQQRQNGVVGAVLGFGAGMVGGLVEPINFLGFGVGSDLALTSARAVGWDLAKTIGGNAAIFAGLGVGQQFAIKPLTQYFGDDITYAQMLDGIALNAAIGGAFGALGTGFRLARMRIGEPVVDARPMAKDIGQVGKPLGDIGTVEDPMRGVSPETGPVTAPVPPVAPIIEGSTRIFDDVFQKARDAGIAPEEAAHYAALYATRYTARAERLGQTDAFGLYNEQPLTIRRDEQPQAPDVGQAVQELQQDPAFRAWFGKSVLKDQTGEPVTLYHGTTESFDTFAPGTKGRGIYLTADPSLASKYADTAWASIKAGGKDIGGNPQVYPVFARLENPVVIEGPSLLDRLQAKVSERGRAKVAEIKRTAKRSAYLTDDQIAEYKRQGHDGIVNKATNEVIVFDPQQIKSAVGNKGTFNPNSANILEQNMGERRGNIRLPEGRAIITLFKDADRSTFLHETGHLWLEELRRDAMRPDAPAGIKADLDTFLKWVGKKDFDKIKREDHEQFARAFEAYLMEGKAPVPALQGLFERFKQWLASIYQTVARLNTPINDEIRGLMDRLLASDRQLSDAQIGAAKRDLNLAVMDLAMGRDPVGPDGQVGAMDAPASVSGDGWQPPPAPEKPKPETLADLAPEKDANEALYAALDKAGKLSGESKAEYEAALEAEAKAAQLEQIYNQSSLGLIKEAAGNLTDKEAKDLLSRVEMLRDRAQRDTRFASTSEALNNLLKQDVEAQKIKAAIARKQAVFNAIRRDMREADLERLRTVYSPTESLLALMRAGNKRVSGVRDSASQTQLAWEKKYTGQVMERIVAERPHVEPMFRNSPLPGVKAERNAFAERVGREVWENHDNGRPGVTGDKDAKWLADTFSRTMEDQRQQLNKMGSGIGKITDSGYLPTEHMQDKIVKVDRADWIAEVGRRYDLEKSFPDAMPEEYQTILGDMYDKIVTGGNGRGARREGQFTSPGNYSSRLSRGRVLVPRSYNDWLAYQKEFGHDNVLATVMIHLRNQARVGGLIDFFGHNPEKMVDSLAQQEIERVAKDQSIKPKTKQALGNQLQSIMDWPTTRVLFGKSDIYMGQKGAGILAGFRSWQYLSKGAGIVLSQLTDPVTMANNMRFQGRPFLPTYAKLVSEYFTKGRGTGETRRVAFLAGEGFNGLIDHLVSPYAMQDTPTGTLSRMTEALFKWTGVSWMDDTGRAIGTRMMAADMGSDAHLSYGELSTRYRNILDLQGITPEKWDVIRSTAWEGENGTRYVTPDRIAALPDKAIEPLIQDRLAEATKDAKADRSETIRQQLIDQARFDLEIDLRRFYADELSMGMLNQPGVRARAITTAGLSRGTWAGEAWRAMMGFKSYTISFTQNVLGRAIHSTPYPWTKAEGILRNSLHVGELVATLTVAGLLSIWMKALAAGRTPQQLTDEKGNIRFETLLSAFMQSGGLGIYGDFIFGRENKYGSDPVQTFAGPAFGDMMKVVDLILTGRDVAYGRAKADELKRKAFFLAQGNVPFIGSPYTKAPLDYLFLNSLREAISPGYLMRQDQQMKKQFGQHSFVGNAWGRH